MYLKMYGGLRCKLAFSFGMHLYRFAAGWVRKRRFALQAENRQWFAGCCRVQLDDRSRAGLHIDQRKHSPDNHEEGIPENKVRVHGRLMQGSSPQPLPLSTADERDGACTVGALHLRRLDESSSSLASVLLGRALQSATGHVGLSFNCSSTLTSAAAPGRRDVSAGPESIATHSHHGKRMTPPDRPQTS